MIAGKKKSVRKMVRISYLVVEIPTTGGTVLSYIHRSWLLKIGIQSFLTALTHIQQQYLNRNYIFITELLNIPVNG